METQEIALQQVNAKDGVAYYTSILETDRDAARFLPQELLPDSFYLMISNDGSGQMKGIVIYTRAADALNVVLLWIAPIHRRSGLGRTALSVLREMVFEKEPHFFTYARNKKGLQFLRANEFAVSHFAEGDEDRGALLRAYPPKLPQLDLEGELRKFLNQENQLTVLPSAPKNRALALNYIVGSFAKNRNYTEKEVNQIINEKHGFSDCALLRRELIVKGLLRRRKDGSAYWR